MIPTLRLPGGTALVAEAVGGARSFAVGFWFPLGSRHEAPHERGFVHFVEHMVFKGTLKRGAASISREIDRVGGYLNAFTDRDSLCLHCQVPVTRWRLSLDILSDMAFNSIFRLEDFEREREVIISEILSALDDPEERSHDEFLTSIWPSDPLSRKIAGEDADIRRITRDALFAFYKKEVTPHSLLVTTSGSVPSMDVAEELTNLLEGLPRSVTERRVETTPSFATSRGYSRADMEQLHFYEAVQLDPPFHEDDYYALAALNGALGEASSSRLFLSLREEKGLCYSVYSAFGMSRTECLWMASATVSEAQLAELSAEMDRQLDSAAENGLGDEECVDAVSRLVGSFDMALEDTDFRMRRMARQALFSGEVQDVDEARKNMERLGPVELNAICVRLLKGRVRAHFAYGGLSKRTARSNGLTETKVSSVSAAAHRG